MIIINSITRSLKGLKWIQTILKTRI
jgi:hypothetical protein